VRRLLAVAGLLPALHGALARRDAPVLAVRSLGLVEALVVSGTARRALVDAGVLAAVVRLLRDASAAAADVVAMAAVCALGCAAATGADPDTDAALAAAGAAAALAAELRRGAAQSHAPAVRALRNFCAGSPVLVQACIAAGVPALLTEFLDAGMPQLALAACSALANMCHGACLGGGPHAVDGLLGHAEPTPRLMQLVLPQACAAESVAAAFTLLAAAPPPLLPPPPPRPSFMTLPPSLPPTPTSPGMIAAVPPPAEARLRVEALSALRNLVVVSEPVREAVVGDRGTGMKFATLLLDPDTLVQGEAAAMLCNLVVHPRARDALATAAADIVAAATTALIRGAAPETSKNLDFVALALGGSRRL
jgi:hypothetical protein